jgi:single-strand DNA-binding protein
MDLNKAILMGHLGRDPEFFAMKQGGELCKFSVATTRKWKDKQTSEIHEDVSWHNVVVFNPYLVDRVCKPWLQKGTRVYLEGELKTRSYDKDGEKRYITEIVIPQVKGELFVEAKGKGWDVNETPGAERGRGGGGQQSAGAAAASALGRGGDYDDGIPF